MTWPVNPEWWMTGLFLLALALLGYVMKLVALLLPASRQIEQRSISWVLVSPDSVLRSQPATGAQPVVLRMLMLSGSMCLYYWVYWQLVSRFHIHGILLSYLAVPVLLMMGGLPVCRHCDASPARWPSASRVALPAVGVAECYELLGPPVESVVQRLVSLHDIRLVAPSSGVRVDPDLYDFRPHARMGDQRPALLPHWQNPVRHHDDLFSPSSGRHPDGTSFPEESPAPDDDVRLVDRFCAFAVRC